MPVTAYSVAYGGTIYTHRRGERPEPEAWAERVQQHAGEAFEWGNVVDRLDPDSPTSTLNYLERLQGRQPDSVLLWLYDRSDDPPPGVVM